MKIPEFSGWFAADITFLPGEEEESEEETEEEDPEEQLLSDLDFGPRGGVRPRPPLFVERKC